MPQLEMELGDRIRDNDPRLQYRRVLTIEHLELGEDGLVVRVKAREGAGRQVYVSCARIHDDGKPRRTGFTLLRATPQERQGLALVGKAVVLRRGSEGRCEGVGKRRTVSARLDRIDAGLIYATLLEDDPLASLPPTKAGESGVWHGLSFLEGPAAERAGHLSDAEIVGSAVPAGL